MSSYTKKQKPTLEFLLRDKKVLTGNRLFRQKIKRGSEALEQIGLLQVAIQFEIQIRRVMASQYL